MNNYKTGCNTKVYSLDNFDSIGIKMEELEQALRIRRINILKRKTIKATGERK